MIESNYSIKALDLHGCPEAKPVKKELLPELDLAQPVKGEPLPGRSLPLVDRPLTLENFSSEKTIYLIICSFLSRQDVGNFSKVCQRFHRIVNYNGRLKRLCRFAEKCIVRDFIQLKAFKGQLSYLVPLNTKMFLLELDDTLINFMQVTSVISKKFISAHKIFFLITNKSADRMYQFLALSGNSAQQKIGRIIRKLKGRKVVYRADIAEKVCHYFDKLLLFPQRYADLLRFWVQYECTKWTDEELEDLSEILKSGSIDTMMDLIGIVKCYERRMAFVAAPIPAPPVPAAPPIAAPVAPAIAAPSKGPVYYTLVGFGSFVAFFYAAILISEIYRNFYIRER